MTCDFLALATPGVQALQPYVPGKPVDELQRELGLTDVVKLASNENPLGPSPVALDAVTRQLPELSRYPDGNGFSLKRALAERLQVTPQQITLGNGSNDILELIARAFADNQSDIVFSEYAFAVYPIVTQAIGAQAIIVPADAEYGHDLTAMAEAITPETRLVFIANPNNPTGTWLAEDEVVAFLQRVPENVLVVLDEAYFEYVAEPNYPNGLKLQQQCPNLIVTRTFSKAWGLASLRVGYAVSHPDIADLLNRVRQPFNVDSLALAAATAVLNDEAYLAQSVQVNRQGMNQLQAGFQALALSWVPSVGNFICVDVGQEASGIYQKLLQQGVIVRPVANYGLPNHLRISIGLEAENARCIQALAQALGQTL